MKKLFLLLPLLVLGGSQPPMEYAPFMLIRAASSTLDTGLQAYWTLDADGTDAIGSADLSNNNLVTFATAGIIGDAALFVAASSQSLSHADGFPFTKGDESFTYSVWVNCVTVSGEMGILGNFTLAGPYVIWFINGTDDFNVEFGNGTTTQSVNGPDSMQSATFYHLVFSYDASANELRLVINDGTPITASYSGGSYDNNDTWYLGHFSGFYFNGLIDEVGVWSRTLTGSEITELYNSGAGFRPPSVP